MANNRSTPSEVSRWIHSYRNLLSTKKREREIHVKLQRIKILKAPKHLAILDLCCGEGEYLYYLSRLGYHHLYGIDLFLEQQPPLLDSSLTMIHADARKTNLPSESFDWILLIHSLHHIGTVEDIASLEQECYRLLRPGGHLSIIDFKRSLPIQAAFFFLRNNLFCYGKYLKNFSVLLQQEWHFVETYLKNWNEIKKLWHQGKFKFISQKQGLFYFYWTLQK